MSSISVDPAIQADFIVEASEIVERLGEQLVDLERRAQDSTLLNAIFRGFHTIKGGAGFLAQHALVELCHAAEEMFDRLRSGRQSADSNRMDAAQRAVDHLNRMIGELRAGETLKPAEADLLQRLRDASPDSVTAPTPVPESPAAPKPQEKPAPETTVRVDTQRLDRIMNLVGELVLVRNRLKTLRSRAADEELERALGNLDQVTTGLQGAVMQVRMQPVRRLFSRFPKLARDVARGLGKQVELVLEGEDTDLDRNLVEALADPMVHLVRNAIDHGIEMPDERARAGKPAAGTLHLSAQQEGDHILLTIRDDGAGMDPDTIRRKAIEKGALPPEAAAKLTPAECLELIFLPGFSTKTAVSDLSGRGVGMDVVRSRVNELNGRVHIDSQPGRGSSFQIRLPLTLAILPALMIRLRDRLFALPLSVVLDIAYFQPARTARLGDETVWVLPQGTLPLCDLRRWVEPTAPAADAQSLVVVAHAESGRGGFLVDEVLGREEVVIKPLGAGLQGVPGIAGATVNGDGRIALILDLSQLFKNRTAYPI